MLRLFSRLSALALACLLLHAAEAQSFTGKDRKAAARLKKHITYLASDELQGRNTGSPGQNLAADYIVKEFKKAGLKPMGDNGTWFQEFKIIQLRISGNGNKLTIGSKDFANFVDFYPVTYSADKGEISADLFNASYGIEAPALNHNDYAGAAAARGRIFLIDLSSPDGNNPHSRFADYNDIRLKVETAIKHGAAAIIFTNSDKNSPDPSGQHSTKIKPFDIPVFFIKKYTNAEIMSSIGTTAKVKADIITVEATGKNVIGFRNNRAKNTVVVGAHYDHLGHGELGGSRTKENGLIHNGADDNASGTAALIELARKLKGHWGKYKKNNYLFIAFSGEELGLIGSKKFTTDPTYPLSNINYMINMDMVGRLDSVKRTLMINGAGTSPAWKPAFEMLKFDSLQVKTTESGVGSSDHTSFYLSNIPAVHFFTGQHSDYHLPADDEDKINYKGEVYVINYIDGLVRVLNKKGKLQFTKTKDDDQAGRMSFKVTLGIMPDYVYSDDGVRVDDITEGKPGALAGLQKGDIIVQLGDIHVHTMQDYMKALSTFKKGDTTRLKIKRNGETKDLTVTF